MRYSGAGMGVAALVALLPFVITDNVFYGAVNAKFFLSVFTADLVAFTAAYLFVTGARSVVWRHRWLVGALLLVVAVWYAASYFGVFLERSLWSDILRSSGILFLTHLAVFSVLLGEILHVHDWQLVRRAVVLSAGAFSFCTLLGVSGLRLFTETAIPFNFAEEGFNFGNSTFAGVYLLLAFMVGLIELYRSWGEVRWRRVLIGALVLVGLSPVMVKVSILWGRTPLGDVFANPALLLGAARASSATMLLVLATLGGWLALGRYTTGARRTYGRIAWVGGLWLAAAVAVALLFVPQSPVQEAYIETSTAARIIVWEGGLEAVSDRPYLGWGPENYLFAHEQYFNNDLYLQENIGEVWFDRAHNLIVDTLVSVGYVGAAAHLLFVLVFLLTVRQLYRRNIVGDVEALVLALILPAHILQLQTGFDTTGSYALLAVIFGYIFFLERQAASGHVAEGGGTSSWMKYAYGVLATLLVMGAILSLKYVVYDEWVRQHALVKTFVTADTESRKALIHTSLAQTSDWETLRVSASSFIKGALEGARHTTDVEGYIANVLETAGVYDEYYKAYETAMPHHYRERMNHAYLLIIESGLGERRLEEARELVNSSYELSPDNPLTYNMGALVFLYGINFDKARELVTEAIALNPGIKFSRQISDYIEAQIDRFPRRSNVLQLGNL